MREGLAYCWDAAAKADLTKRFIAALIDGVLAGVGSVLVFLPQILILFFFILVLEDSGYLPRAAFLLDRLMQGLGLSGRAFIPLLSSFACAVPGIMATRTIPNVRDRLATIMIAPLMTCSARLPVYALVINAFIPDKPLLGPVLSSRTAVMLGLYVLGFAAASLALALLSSPVLAKGDAKRGPRSFAVLYQVAQGESEDGKRLELLRRGRGEPGGAAHAGGLECGAVRSGR